MIIIQNLISKVARKTTTLMKQKLTQTRTQGLQDKHNETNWHNHSWLDWDGSFRDNYTPNFNTHYSEYECGD